MAIRSQPIIIHNSHAMLNNQIMLHNLIIMKKQREAKMNTEVKQQPPVNDKLKQEADLGIFTLKIFIAAVIIVAIIVLYYSKRKNIYGIKNRNPKDKNGSITLYE